MNVPFQLHHGAMLLKYSGISFISGAVNHGFFSGERSLWTAAVGMLLFVVGASMEHRLSDNPDEPRAGLLRTLALGALLSIGLGFFTGGLQHFPDSPARSAWVVPLGFLISVVALAVSGAAAWRASSTVYTAVAGVLISAGSYGAWQWLESNPQFLGTHAHGGGDVHAHEGLSAGLSALSPERSIEVRMDDRMRFTPDSLEVRAGETVRLIVYNDGKVLHELVLGGEAQIREHAEAMRKGAGDHHEPTGSAAVEVGPGSKKDLIVRFSQAGTLQMACLIPGHYEAGMRGAVRISEGLTPPGGTSTKAANTPHDHSTHKH